MKRITAFLLGAAALTAIPAAARQLTPNEALQRAFTSAQTSGARIKALNNDTQLLYTVSSDNQAGAYVMASPHTDGYVIISADDVAVPVLGYSDNGTFDATEINPELNYWLNEYGREIAWAIANNVAPAKTKAIANDFATIEPMCTTKWNQDSPYNDSCPIDPSTGKRSVTGCVATAMAQVMKYHNWPEQGKGSISYQYNGMSLSMDFSKTQFDWANMTNTYTATSTDVQKSAVALLMEACGKSVKMMYSSNASGAYSNDVPKALMNYLNYASTAIHISRSNFGLRSWEKIIYSQLTDFGPVYYSGQTSDISGQSAGHAYVCDGYRTDGYFHFNWGWGGMSDGYFRLTALDPDAQGIGGSSSGFNYSQAIVAGVQKPDNAKPFRLFYAKDLNVTSEQVLLGDRVVFSGGFYYCGATRATGVGLGMIAVNDETKEESYFPFTSGASYDNGQGAASMTVVTPVTLAEGTYTLRPAYTIDNVRNLMYIGLGATYISMSVKDGKATFKRPTAANITTDKLETLSNVIIGSRFMAEATFTNPTLKEFYNKVYTSILSKGSDGKYTV
ncbi:MAG: C10 family peptidase, partial [Muribaculaceae bacterium]|nr:C10 family peptidase [Muribaculaceae bacterium]